MSWYIEMPLMELSSSPTKKHRKCLYIPKLFISIYLHNNWEIYFMILSLLCGSYNENRITKHFKFNKDQIKD